MRKTSKLLTVIAAFVILTLLLIVRLFAGFFVGDVGEYNDFNEKAEEICSQANFSVQITDYNLEVIHLRIQNNLNRQVDAFEFRFIQEQASNLKNYQATGGHAISELALRLHSQPIGPLEVDEVTVNRTRNIDPSGIGLLPEGSFILVTPAFLVQYKLGFSGLNQADYAVCGKQMKTVRLA